MTGLFAHKLKKTDKLAVLTGAGISAESGIQTFRASDGLWENHSVYDVATPEGFKRNPELVWRFYRERYNQAASVEPNPGHYALKSLEEFLGDNFLLITQNVDGLHKRAGSERVIEMHGSLQSTFCSECRKLYPMSMYITENGVPECPSCRGAVRPDIVWFGEVPYEMEKIYDFLETIDYLLVCGTSGSVYPAADFLRTSKSYGAKTIGVNLDKPQNIEFIDYFFQGASGEILPELIKRWCDYDE